MRPGSSEFRGLISASRMHRNRTSDRYKYSCPRFGACTRHGESWTIFHVPSSAVARARGRRRPVTSAGGRARVILPKGIAPTKEHDCRRGIGIVFETGRAFSVTRAIDRGPLFDCRIGEGVHAAAASGIELTATCRYR